MRHLFVFNYKQAREKKKVHEEENLKKEREYLFYPHILFTKGSKDTKKVSKAKFYSKSWRGRIIILAQI
ncbi:hypothetical protein ACJIZ3_013329 [Penstemon smallii]|uniref:Uncharacterized protein n=1 Tax=Penstemon smallii TaxID=265156 RepID=A0ABD3UPJ0_9LAMI